MKPGAYFQKPVIFAGAILPLAFPSNLKCCPSKGSMSPIPVKAVRTGATTLLKSQSTLIMQTGWDSGSGGLVFHLM